jgi:hypothetical protein
MKRAWEKIVVWAGTHLGLKILAVAIALGLWLAGQKNIERAIEVPVVFRNIPQDLMVTDSRVDYVVLRLTGPRTLLSTLGPENLKLTLDLDGVRPGPTSIPLGPGSFNPPRGVRIARISPSVVHLSLEPVAERVIPVVVRFAGKPPFGFRVAGAEVDPENVVVHGPANEVKRLTSAQTVPIELGKSGAAVKRSVRLSTEGKRLSFSPERVAVTIELEEERITREFGGVDLRAKDFAGEYRVSPRTVYLRLSGPKHALGALEMDSGRVYLDLNGLGPGEHLLSLNFNLPGEVTVLEQKPERFKVRITKSEASSLQ